MPLSRDTSYTQSGVIVGATLQAQQTTARRIPPGALWVAAATIVFLLSVVAGLWRLADPPRSAPPNVTPAIINPAIGAAPVEPMVAPDAAPAPVLMPPVVYVFPTPTPSPHQPRVSPRGGPIPTAAPGVVRVPIMGSWKMYYPPREDMK